MVFCLLSLTNEENLFYEPFSHILNTFGMTAFQAKDGKCKVLFVSKHKIQKNVLYWFFFTMQFIGIMYIYTLLHNQSPEHLIF